MKLVEILARELRDWPECVGSITQDPGRDLVTWTGHNPVFSHDDDEWVWGMSMDECDYGYIDDSPSELSEDYIAAIITREMWQAERDRIAAAEGKPKEAKWIRHLGGKCPVADGVKIQVRYRDGLVRDSEAGDWHSENWNHDDVDRDIMAYRIIEEEKQEMAVSELTIKVDTSDVREYVEECIATIQSTDGPLDWRDRIREIDAQQVAMTNERAELVAKLAAEGLALCGEPVKAMRPVQDMNDPSNWQVGDQVEIKASDNPGWTKFKGVTGQLENDGDWWISFPDDGVWYVSNNTTVKWHSRP